MGCDVVDIFDISAESLVIGSLYKNPSLLFEYEELLYPEWDFTNDQLKFLYVLIKHCYLMKYKIIDETVLNIEINKNPEWVEEYKKAKGYKTIVRLIDKAKLEDFKKYFADLKKFNLLRELERKGFPIQEKLEKLITMETEDIYAYFDYGLTKTFSHYQGVEDSIILGKDMTERFEQWQIDPDIGIEIPFWITNNLIRGWRIGKLNATGLHSGFGKSRMLCNTVVDIGIIKKTPILLIVNEQDKEEWDEMLLTCVVNNYFIKNNMYINETNIVTGELTNQEKEICREASKWIEDNTFIYFQDAQVYDYNTLKRILKTHKLKGCNYFVLDTFKPFRNAKGATWEAFVQTSEMLKQLCGNKKKGGLDMAGWITFQLTDDSLFDKILNSTSVASGKQIKHNLDLMQLARPLSYSEKLKIKVKIMQKDNPFNDTIQELDLFKDYYICFIDKNRGGLDKTKIIMEVNKGSLIFKEIGYAVFENKKDEDLIVDRK
jgi:replicative DNA helicase